MPDDQKPGQQPDDASKLKPEDRLKPEDVYDPDRTPEDEEHARRMKELFGDLDDGDGEEETIADVRADRDDLRDQVDRLKASVARTRKENSALLQKVNEGKQAIAGVEEARAQDRRDAATAFLTSLVPAANQMTEGLKEIDATARAANPKLDKLTVGVENTLSQLTAVFNKYGIRPDAGLTPAAKPPVDDSAAKPPVDDPAAKPDEDLLQDKPDPAAKDEGGKAPEAKPAVVETIETLRAERDALLAESGQMASTIAKAQNDNLTLTRRIEEGKALLAREEQSRESDRQYAIEKPLKDLMPVIDTLEMGLRQINDKARKEDPNFDFLAKTVEGTLASVKAVFNSHGVSQIDPVNQPFDEEKHEAVTMAPRDDVDPGTVIHVVQKGYQLHDRNVRHAKVVVTPFD